MTFSKYVLIFLLVCAVGAGSWFAAGYYTENKMQQDTDSSPTQAEDSQQQLQNGDNSEDIVENVDIGDDSEDIVDTVDTEDIEETISPETLAIIEASEQLIEYCVTIQEVYEYSCGGIITYSEPMTYNDITKINEYNNALADLEDVEATLARYYCPSQLQPVKDLLLSGLDSNYSGLRKLHPRQSVSTYLPGAIIIYPGGEDPYAAAGSLRSEAKADYDAACEEWQSVLDEYDISYSDIGLYEPLCSYFF